MFFLILKTVSVTSWHDMEMSTVTSHFWFFRVGIFCLFLLDCFSYLVILAITKTSSRSLERDWTVNPGQTLWAQGWRVQGTHGWRWQGSRFRGWWMSPSSGPQSHGSEIGSFLWENAVKMHGDSRRILAISWKWSEFSDDIFTFRK